MKKTLLIIFSLIILTGVAKNSYSTTGYNAVLEYCTGTWCQYCPCGESVIDGILANYPNTMILGYHGPVGYGDPWAVTSQPMISAFGFNAYPTGVVNRTSGIIDRSGWNNKVVVSANSFQPGVSLTINNWNYNSSTHTITANIVTTALTDLTGNYYIMMVLTEDNLIFSQTGNSGCPGSGAWNHKYVVQGLINGANGTLLAPSDNWTTGQTATTSLNYTFPAGVIDANCKFNVFVYNSTGGNIGIGNTIQQSKTVPATTGPTGIINQNLTPEKYNLSQNYPNPFNPTTKINFSLPKDGNTSLKFYDMLGNEVATYVDGFMKSGTYNVEFDASSLASGIYFYTLKTNDYVETKKMSLIK